MINSEFWRKVVWGNLYNPGTIIFRNPLYCLAKKLKIPEILICYGTALHGKCECDSLGGGMKGILKRVGLAGGEVYTASEMAKVLSEHPSKHVDKWIHVTPREHFDMMLNDYKIQPNEKLYQFKDIKKCHMWTFKYTDAEMKTDPVTEQQYLALPYKVNNFLVKPGDGGWTERVIRLHPDYENTDKFEYEKLNYYVDRK